MVLDFHFIVRHRQRVPEDKTRVWRWPIGADECGERVRIARALFDKPPSSPRVTHRKNRAATSRRGATIDIFNFAPQRRFIRRRARARATKRTRRGCGETYERLRARARAPLATSAPLVGPLVLSCRLLRFIC